MGRVLSVLRYSKTVLPTIPLQNTWLPLDDLASSATTPSLHTTLHVLFKCQTAGSSNLSIFAYVPQFSLELWPGASNNNCTTAWALCCLGIFCHLCRVPLNLGAYKFSGHGQNVDRSFNRMPCRWPLLQPSVLLSFPSSAYYSRHFCKQCGLLSSPQNCSSIST